MECFECGHDHDFDRVAIDRRSGEVLGTLCNECEDDLIHRTTAIRASMAACLICGNDPDIFFPQWDTLVKDGETTIQYEYTISLDTPACCIACAVQAERVPVEHAGDRAATD